MVDFVELGVRKSQRREWIAKAKTHCPKCDSEQVQLLDCSIAHTQVDFRCRECKHLFSAIIKLNNKLPAP